MCFMLIKKIFFQEQMAFNVFRVGKADELSSLW